LAIGGVDREEGGWGGGKEARGVVFSGEKGELPV